MNGTPTFASMADLETSPVPAFGRTTTLTDEAVLIFTSSEIFSLNSVFELKKFSQEIKTAGKRIASNGRKNFFITDSDFLFSIAQLSVVILNSD